MSEEEKIIQELTEVRPEMLNEKALKLFNFMMKKLDELEEKEKEIKIKNEYMQLALDLLSDYDGWYDAKTRKGNLEGLVQLINEVNKYLKYGIANDDTVPIYGMGYNEKILNILQEEIKEEN